MVEAFVRSVANWSFVMVLALSICETATAQERGKKPTHFDEVQGFEDAKPLTPEILAVVMDTAPAKGRLRGDLSTGESVSSYFRATEVHLRNSSETDLVIEGQGPMMGANLLWFWVVLSANDHPRVAMYQAASELDIRRSKHQGFREIETSRIAGSGTISTVTWRYADGSYRPVKF